MSILLVPYDSRFLEALHESREDETVKQYNPVESLPIESLRERMSGAHSDFADFENAELFFWFVRSGKELVGNISVRHINREMLIAEIGYGTVAQARDKGYATAAVQLVTQNAFRQTPLRKLIAYVHEDNQPSRRVLEKVGYKREGLLREHYLVNGSPANEIVYGILRGEVVV